MASLKIVNEDEEDKIPLDLPAIREGMIRGICATEHALFNHAFFESNRLEKMRRLVNMIEEKVLREDFVDQLNPYELMGFYKNLLNNQTKSVEFLQNLHTNVSSAVESLTYVEKQLKSTNISESEIHSSSGSDKKLEYMKSLILNKIERKTKENKK